MATSDVDAWGYFSEGGALSADVVSRSEAEEMSMRVAELEDEVRPSYRPRRDPQLFTSFLRLFLSLDATPLRACR